MTISSRGILARHCRFYSSTSHYVCEDTCILRRWLVALAGQAGLAGVAWLAGLRPGLAGLAGVTGQLGHHGLRELSKEAHWFGVAHRAAIFISLFYYLSITYPITYPIAYVFFFFYLSIS